MPWCEPMISARLGGWLRLSIVLFVLWALFVAAYSAYELTHGQDSRMLLIHMKEVGQRGYEGRNGAFQTVVIVTQASLIPWRLALALLAPPLLVLSCAAAINWIRNGFRRDDA